MTLGRSLPRWLLLLTLWAGVAYAGTDCTVSTSGVAFGSFDPIANTNRDVNGTITVTCTGNIGASVSYRLMLSAGGGTFPTRKMASGANNLNYNLYTDSARTSVWGDGSGATSIITDSYTFAVSPTVRTYTVYGRIPKIGRASCRERV